MLLLTLLWRQLCLLRSLIAMNLRLGGFGLLWGMVEVRLLLVLKNVG